MSTVALDALRAFLDARDLGSGPVTLERVGGGHSLETYRVTRDGFDAILRRPPRVLSNERAHDVLREARVLSRLQGHGIRAPAVLAVCDEPAVLGVPFMLVERLEGVVIGTDLPDALDTPEERRRISADLVDALVDLHGFEWRRGALSDLSRTDGAYLQRQLDLFERIWERDKIRDVEGLTELTCRLRETVPAAGAMTLIHGDYRLGNVLFREEAPAHLTGILDWETAALGDPLTDLGYTLATYSEPGDDEGVLLSLSSVTARPGFMTRAELAERYALRSGHSVDDLPWYEGFCQWKVAIILEGSYRRYTQGEADDTFYAELEEGVPELIARAGRALGIA